MSDLVPRIETERLILRAFEEGDEPAVGFYTDPEVMRYIPRGPWKPVDVGKIFKRMVENRRNQWRDAGFGMWAVVLKKTGTVIGHCGLQRIENGEEVEVFYLIDKPFWNQGITTEATLAALRFADALGLEKVVALAMPDNGASQRVMQKSGMTHVGHAHHYGFDLVKYELRSTRAAKADSERTGGKPTA